MIDKFSEQISSGNDLTAEQMGLAMEEILGGKASDSQIARFLTALSEKGEAVEEVSAAAEVMRRHCTRVDPPSGAVLDTCGTGGDAKGTFNISTAAAFVASGCGITVAKHGNHSISSASGSADILQALGVEINLPAQRLSLCLKQVGIAFLFAPQLHPAMKYAMPARRSIAGRTIFNLLGPLSNPAGARHQLVGVFAKRWVVPLASVLANLGARHALVVHGEDGLDEITTTAKTFVAEAKGRQVSSFEVTPEEFGFKRSSLEDLRGASASSNAELLLRIFNGEKGPQRDIVVLNAAAAVYAADQASSIKQAITLAEESIDSGRALEKLQRLREFSRQ